LVVSQVSHERPILGVALKLVSVVLLASMAACVKYLGQGIPSGEIIFVRGLISSAVLMVLAWRIGMFATAQNSKPAVACAAFVVGHSEHVQPLLCVDADSLR
jgi:drug/metabolite transporter (DMT)-like permease